MTGTFQNILFLISIVVVAGLGWYMYTENQSQNLRMTSESGADLRSETLSFIQQQRELRELNMRTTLQDDRNFRNLSTITAPVPEYDIGRDNPFAPSI